MIAQLDVLDDIALPVAARGGATVPLFPQVSAPRPAQPHAPDGESRISAPSAPSRRRCTYQKAHWVRLKQLLAALR